MNDKNKKLLLIRVSEVLHYVWDPVGISHIPQARDEYDSYVPVVVNALVDGKDIVDISKILFDIETGLMGLEGDLADCKDVSELLIEWREAIEEQ